MIGRVRDDLSTPLLKRKRQDLIRRRSDLESIHRHSGCSSSSYAGELSPAGAPAAVDQQPGRGTGSPRQHGPGLMDGAAGNKVGRSRGVLSMQRQKRRWPLRSFLGRRAQSTGSAGDGAVLLPLSSATSTGTVPDAPNSPVPGSPAPTPTRRNGFSSSHRSSSSRRWSKRERLRYILIFVTVAAVVSVLLPLYKFYSFRATAFADKFVAFPPDNIKVSAVIMNHARPHLLQQSDLLPVLCHHPAVSEILILHSDPATAFTNSQLHHIAEREKIQHIDASAKNRELGLAIRFHYCSTQCSNEWVMHVDDDMELDYTAINHLLQHMILNSQRIVGHYGRRYSFWRAPHRQGYDTTLLSGRAVEVVLTKILVMERRICGEFLKYASIVDDLLPESIPRWNGEDIFVNLVANHYYGVPSNGPFNNYAIANLHVWEAQIDEKKAIGNITSTDNNDGDDNNVSGNMDRTHLWTVGPARWWRAYRKATAHTQYRGRLWYAAKQRLAAVKD